MGTLVRLLAWLRRPVIGVSLTLLACASVAGLLQFAPSLTLDRLLYDARVRAQTAGPEDRVLIVDIDERSLARVGRWPWPRETIGELIDRLSDAGASAIGVDIVFAEVQREPGQDERLARQLHERPVVLGYYFTSDRDGRRTGKLPPPAMDARVLADSGHRITTWSGYGANIAPVQDAAVSAGFFNPVLDPDGIVRALPLLAEFEGGLYESLAVAVLRRHLGAGNLQLRADALVLKGARGTARIPLSDGLSALVPFAGLEGAPGESRIRSVSAADVLEARLPADSVRGRVVLIGTSAPGLTDLRATPVRAAFPGVEVHATLIAAALDQSRPMIRERSEVSTGVGVIAVALAGFSLAFALPMVGAVGAVVFSVVAAVGLWLAGSIAWANFGLVVPVATGLILVAVLAMLNLAAGYFVEGRARRAVAGLFGEYVSPALVDRMMRDPSRFAAAASENRELTMLFVDIRGFTRIAETMEPEPLREYINAFLTAMTEVVHRYGGTVDKYIGDAVMAFWGAPIEDPQHADHAVAAALSMLDEVARLNQEFELRGLPLIRIGVGVNTGVVRVGDMGSRVRRSYTVIGDAVNLASRFESLTKEFDAPIIVGESTMRQAQGHCFTELGRARVAGRAEAVRIFAPEALAVTRPMQDGKTEVDEQSSGDRLNEGARIRL